MCVYSIIKIEENQYIHEKNLKKIEKGIDTLIKLEYDLENQERRKTHADIDEASQSRRGHDTAAGR